MVKIQINGGSLFLNDNQTQYLPMEKFLPHCEIEHVSVPAKSIHSIVMDVYNNLGKFDVFVLNFTMSDRFHLWVDDCRFEMSVGRDVDGMLPLPKFKNNADFLESKIRDFKDNYYKYFANIEYNVEYSKMLIDSCISILDQNNKKYILSTCEPFENLISKGNQHWICAPEKGVYSVQLLEKHTDSNGHLNSSHLANLASLFSEFGKEKKLW